MNKPLTFLLLSASLLAAEGKPNEQPAPSSELEAAVDAIKQQVSWFGTQKKHQREFLLSVATINYVQARVSPFNYALRINRGQKLPRTPEDYLHMRAGICGGQVMTARAILTRLGVRNRPIEFYLHGMTSEKNSSHIGLETFYNDSWHFFDVTWGSFFRKAEAKTDQVLSIAKVLKQKDPMQLGVINEADLWYQQWKAAGHDPFIYLKSTNRDLIVDRGGTIRLRSQNGTLYKPIHQPNYIGRSSLKHAGTVAIKLLKPASNVNSCTINIQGIAGTGQLVLTAGKELKKIPLRQLKVGANRITLNPALNAPTIQIRVLPESPNKVGYIVIKQIELK